MLSADLNKSQTEDYEREKAKFKSKLQNFDGRLRKYGDELRAAKEIGYKLLERVEQLKPGHTNKNHSLAARSYCETCLTKTETRSAELLITDNRRAAIKGICTDCGHYKSSWVDLIEFGGCHAN